MVFRTFAVTSAFKFELIVGTSPLGMFTSCDGLGCHMDVEERREGGLNDRVWQLTSGLHYSNITLSRPLTEESLLIWQWISQQTLKPRRLTSQLIAYLPNHAVMMRWILDGVVPVSWSGPSFNTDQNDPGRETLEIAHNGFLAVSPL